MDEEHLGQDARPLVGENIDDPLIEAEVAKPVLCQRVEQVHDVVGGRVLADIAEPRLYTLQSLKVERSAWSCLDLRNGGGARNLSSRRQYFHRFLVDYGRHPVNRRRLRAGDEKQPVLLLGLEG